MPQIKVYWEANTKRMTVACVDNIQIQPWVFVYPIPTFLKVCHICSIGIIIFVLWISFSMNNLIMERFD